MGITPQEYQQRRQAFMTKIGQGTAILRSAPHAVMHNDVEYNFRQDSDFYYLTGFNEPNAVAVFAPPPPGTSIYSVCATQGSCPGNLGRLPGRGRRSQGKIRC